MNYDQPTQEQVTIEMNPVDPTEDPRVTNDPKVKSLRAEIAAETLAWRVPLMEERLKNRIREVELLLGIAEIPEPRENIFQKLRKLKHLLPWLVPLWILIACGSGHPRWILVPIILAVFVPIAIFPAFAAALFFFTAICGFLDIFFDIYPESPGPRALLYTAGSSSFATNPAYIVYHMERILREGGSQADIDALHDDLRRQERNARLRANAEPF